ncbi:fas-binding factor 1 isoform 1-T5 [Callospermophilus lateralis]|uniref:fas-binding factor 1 isoform X1 n=2 Tax=Callospermophilus lateralis TaxID=76772 RepID=UPI004053F34E
MASKTKKGLKDSIDEVLGDLLGDDMALPEKPVELASHARGSTRAPQGLPSSKSRARSLLEDNIFDTLVEADAEISYVSEADPQALLQTMKDLDDMDADILGLKRSHPASGKTATKGSGKEELPSNPRSARRLAAGEKGDTVATKQPTTSPSSFGHQYRKLSFGDLEDPLAGLLSDEEEDIAKKPPVTESKTASNRSPIPVREQGPCIPLTPGDTPIRKKELLFDDGDDIMATLGFGDSPKGEKRQMGDQEGPRPARSKLDELLGRSTASKLLAHPSPGQHREFKLDKKYQKPQDKEEDSWDNEDLIFGAYQPTVGSSEGPQSRRQSVRVLEGGPDPKGEPGTKQSPPAASSPISPRKGGADWLGLKDDDLDLLPPSPTRESCRGGLAISTPSVPGPVSQYSALDPNSAPSGLPSSGSKPPAENTGPSAQASQSSKLRESEAGEEKDWLSHVLSGKKSQGVAREEHAEAYKGPNSVGTASQPVISTQGLNQAAVGRTSGATEQEVPAARPLLTGFPESWSHSPLALPAGDPKRRTASGDPYGTEPAVCFPKSQEPTGLSVPVKPPMRGKPGSPVSRGPVGSQAQLLTWDSSHPPLQSLFPEPLEQSLLPGVGYQKQLLAAQAQLQSGTAQLQAELLQSHTRLAELEVQVRKLELERTQHQLLLESLQQRHQADLELIENAHRSRIKMLETSYQQREDRLRRENEELSAQYLSHCHEAEQARAELTAQHQRRLAAAAQEKDQEMERLRELQRASILEMRKDHEEQLQRLKLLKDREIDAVTSATSHTRSLNGIIEQMEKFSSSLNELSSRVEASHLTTSQERELGIRHQDEHLRALQERLGRQQQDMEEERARLQEVIGKMEARLSEQSRLLEKERWRVNAEQSKAESMQRALEEQRKVLAQQIAIEREELERAKSALLEEQKSVMQKCGEERQRLAAEWAEFFTQQKLSKERSEREAERALQVDTRREGTLISLAKEQGELRVRASELRAKEEQLATEREAVDRERRELQQEKERVRATSLRLQRRAEEVEHMSQVASKKYQEGEQALQEARQLQSEQQARLQAVRQQQERLQQQEQHVHQEHLSLAQQRLQLDRARQDLPSSLPGLFSTGQGPAASSLGAFSALVTPTPTTLQGSQLLASPGPAKLLAKLVLLKHTAEQDRDFLENEQFFLNALKNASYNMTSHST